MAESVEDMCVRAAGYLQHDDLNWLINRAAHQIREAMDAEASAHGLSIRGQIVLTALAQQPTAVKPVTQLALSTALGLDKTTMTAVLDRLESQGLIQRTPDPNDRRARIPVLTEAGREQQAKVFDKLMQVEHAMVAHLDRGEVDKLKELLRKLVAAGDHVDGSCV
ncbi:MarR family transcriptional regulator [Actinocrispum sp. NPDC049592]|uniref:MarR family winged helix-turn-helix transcriptional regulator n=1 Tax=Actinocrispum sp. NPDC049592 TaxID=3154835 RepID=UPI0034438B94